MVLLAGGRGRSFSREDHNAVAEDLKSLKRLFCSCGVAVDSEMAMAEEVVDLMALSMEKLILFFFFFYNQMNLFQLN